MIAQAAASQTSKAWVYGGDNVLSSVRATRFSANFEILWSKAKEMITVLGLAALVLGVLGSLFVKWVNRGCHR
ncbi:MAG: hypothetical protein H0X66_18390 [Verrucomicrobia bacterium]|nr:hypothetical protein [Verrucomicrobiota bacterium]